MEAIALYLMNKKGWSVLSAVLDKFGKDAIYCVITARDAAMAKDYFDEIVLLCESHQVPLYERTAKNIPEAKYKIAIGWRWIIADEKNLIVLHDSLLPRYRGYAPLVNALINGEKEVGVTALFATAEFDKGNIIGQLSLPVIYPVKISSAVDSVSNLYEQLVVNIFNQLKSGKLLQSKMQDETQATYSLWREEEDYRIDWNKPSSFIKRFIDSVGFPFKGASTKMDNTLMRVMDAVEIPDVHIENRDAGKIIFIHDGAPVVVCGIGLLKLNEVQDEEGKSLLPFRKFRVRFR